MDHFCRQELQMLTEVVNQQSLRVFSMDALTWRSVMDRIFVDCSLDNMYNGEPCRLQDSYIHTAQVASSLWSCEIIAGSQASSVEANLRNRLFQPDVRNDKKPLWFYAALQ